MSERSVNASTFKAECLGLLDHVAATGQPLVITKRGKPIARVVPVEVPAPLHGSVTYRVDEIELIAPLSEAWEAARG